MSRNKKSKTSTNAQESKTQLHILEEQDNNEDAATQIIQDESKLRGHSTPVRDKDICNNIESSPEANYHYSPILFPCTQETNEITWDWYSSTKHSCDKKRSENELISTPKQNKLLQRKRNSNSPLLYKPLKRKLIKGDNTDSIGMFAAELQALTEKMKSCIQHNENVDEMKKDECLSSNSGKENTYKTSTATISINNQDHNVSFEELFNDSIEDVMVKCSQEIEEKFNMGSSTKETSGTNSSNSCSISENSKNSLLSLNSPLLTVNRHAKTYSKKVNKSDQLSEKTNPSLLLLNVTTSDDEKSANKRTTMRRHNSELYEIPDDSFDDCLATCIEDEKLLSVTAEYNDKQNSYERVALNSKCKNNNKFPTNSRTTNNNSSLNKSNEKSNNTMDLLAVEHRKFFKTKSLSDSYFSGEKSLGVRVSTAPNSSNIMQISTNTTTLQSRQSVQDSRVTINGNKANTQTVCTAEEIERKRLEAKMRLEAKRKFQIQSGKIPI